MKSCKSSAQFQLGLLDYSSDISKSNIRQISKSNISETAAIFEKW